jgi:ankyrin repeat protein
MSVILFKKWKIVIGCVLGSVLVGYLLFSYQNSKHQMFYFVLGEYEEVEQYLRRNPNTIEKTNFMGTSPLHQAAGGNEDPRVIKSLLEAGAKVNMKDEIGETPLMAAASNGNPEVIKTLLESGADIEATDDFGVNILMRAAMNPNPDVMQMLIDHGADVHYESEGMGDVISFAASVSRTAEAVQHLINAGALEEKSKEEIQKLIELAERNKNLKGTKVIERMRALQKNY